VAWHGARSIPNSASASGFKRRPSEKFLRRRMGFKFPYDAGIFFTTVMSA
jgi:hypothetical protein